MSKTLHHDVKDNNCDDPHADLVMSKKALSLFQEDEEHGQRKTKRKVAVGFNQLKLTFNYSANCCRHVQWNTTSRGSERTLRNFWRRKQQSRRGR